MYNGKETQVDPKLKISRVVGLSQNKKPTQDETYINTRTTQNERKTKTSHNAKAKNSRFFFCDLFCAAPSCYDALFRFFVCPHFSLFRFVRMFF